MGFLPDRKPGLHRIENWYASTPTNQINFELRYWERESLRLARNKVSQIGLKVKRCQGLLKAFMLIPVWSSSVDYLIFDLLLRPWKLELWSQRIPLQYMRMKTCPSLFCSSAWRYFRQVRIFPTILKSSWFSCALKVFLWTLNSAQAGIYATMFLGTGQPVFRTTCFRKKTFSYSGLCSWMRDEQKTENVYVRFIIMECNIVFIYCFEKWTQFVWVFALT